MQSKRKSNGVITHDVQDNAIVFTVGAESFRFDLSKVNPAMITQAAMHGFVQKISDRAAIGRDPETGASATPEEKFAAMKETAERLMAGGPWNATPTGGTGSAGGLLYRAMRALYPNAWSDRVTFAAYIAERALSETSKRTDGKKVSEDDVRKALMGTKRISKEIERMRVEEGKSVQIDTSEMLQELEAK